MTHPGRGSDTLKITGEDEPTFSVPSSIEFTAPALEKMKEKMKKDPSYDEELFNVLTWFDTRSG